MKKLLATLTITGLMMAPAIALAHTPPEKVTVCHKGHDISISENAVKAHLKHGDSVGSCDVTPSPTPTPEPTESPTPEPTPSPTPEPTEPPAPSPTKHVVSHPCTFTGWSGVVGVGGVKFYATVKLPCANSMLDEDMARAIVRRFVRTGSVAGLANPATVTVTVRLL
jgi:hypothetical protein